MKPLSSIVTCLLAISCNLDFFPNEGKPDYLPFLGLAALSTGVSNLPDPGARGTPCIVREDFTLNPDQGVITNFYDPLEDGYRTAEIPVSFGPQNPGAVIYVRQDHPFQRFSGDSRTIHFRWKTPAGSEFTNVGADDMGSFGAQVLPYARDATFALGSPHYPAYETQETYALSFVVPVNDKPVTGSVLRSCTPVGEEKDYVTDTAYTAENGLSHEWGVWKHLNVHIIFIKGAHELATEEGFRPAMERMREIFAEQSVRIHLHFTTATVEDDSLLSVTDRFEEDAVLGSVTTLLANTAHVQREDAVNVIVVRDAPQLGFLPGYISGAASLAGEKKSAATLALGHISGIRLAGDVLTHEAGHSLGLFHPTETYNGNLSHDPLIETPICDIKNDSDGDGYLLPSDCDGLEFSDSASKNIMWSGSESRIYPFTGEQAYVMRLNPLVYDR